ncbi:hypothetical protein [Nocardioides sp.]|uniref:hypothetical protein n=1 Tax=Nocardioides sp. TaxID=35761 RepID=UPI0026308002|nr:hypothetical protein [Nocardioides sp.]
MRRARTRTTDVSLGGVACSGGRDRARWFIAVFVRRQRLTASRLVTCRTQAPGTSYVFGDDQRAQARL